MKNKDQYIKEAQTQIERLGTRIDQLEADLNKRQVDASANYERKLADLKVKRAEATDKLSEVQEAGEDAWQKLGEGCDKIIDDVRQTYDQVKSSLAG